MPNIQHTTAMLYVPDFQEALTFFRDVLGFSVPYRMTNYAYLEKEGAGLRILEEKGRVPVPPGLARTTVYFDVLDVDAIHDEMRPRLAGLPQGSVNPPEDFHWGQHEFSVRMPDGNWLAFGQASRGK